MEAERLTPELKQVMDQALRYAMTGQGDPEFIRRVRAEARKIRQHILQKHGLLDIGVSAIRELRDE